jgi:hypothetical protein
MPAPCVAARQEGLRPGVVATWCRLGQAASVPCGLWCSKHTKTCLGLKRMSAPGWVPIHSCQHPAIPSAYPPSKHKANDSIAASCTNCGPRLSTVLAEHCLGKAPAQNPSPAGVWDAVPAIHGALHYVGRPRPLYARTQATNTCLLALAKAHPHAQHTHTRRRTQTEEQRTAAPAMHPHTALLPVCTYTNKHAHTPPPPRAVW